MTLISRVVLLFQSTLPSQGATGSLIMLRFVPEFQSTLPSQGATALAALNVGA